MEIFLDSRSIYGARKIKAELSKLGYQVSRRKIMEIMKYQGLKSKYEKARSKKTKTGANFTDYRNLVQRHFTGRKPFEVIVADVTYVYFDRRLYYLCVFMDIATRMIVGSSVSTRIGTGLVESALYSMSLDLNKVKIFHTDRGSEFNNIKINALFASFEISRSLSNVSSPLDNAVIESLNNIVKIEWKFGLQIDSISEFKTSWYDYVDWYNNERLHGSLGYVSPANYMKSLDKNREVK